MRILIHCVTMAGLITCAASAAAHHSFAAEFSYEFFGSREGEVVEVHFVNPHAQSSAPQNLLRRGWSHDSIKVGDRITIEGNLGLANSRKLWINTMTLENGTVIYASGGDN